MLDDEIATIFEDIAETMLGVSLEVLKDDERAVTDDAALTASIVLSGDFEGVLSATFSGPLARAVASLLLQQPAPESSLSDVRDAVGEIVNIAAGNLKGVLPPCQLSLPSVRPGAPRRASERGGRMGHGCFRVLGEPLWVELAGSRRA